MARARNIKPSFFHNADLVDLPVETRLLFIGLWTIADREGRLEDRPKQIKMELYPADSFDVDTLLNQLNEAGFIQRYVNNNNKYIHIVNFTKHQNPHVKEVASTIPAPDEHQTCTMQSRLIPDSPSLIPDSSETPLSGKPDVRRVFDHWREVMTHPRAVLDTKRTKLIARWLKPGSYTADDLCQAIDGCSKTPHNMGQNDTGTRYDDLGLILRDADHIDRFRRNAEIPPTGASHETRQQPTQQPGRAERFHNKLAEYAGKDAEPLDSGPVCKISGTLR